MIVSKVFRKFTTFENSKKTCRVLSCISLYFPLLPFIALLVKMQVFEVCDIIKIMKFKMNSQKGLENE